MGRSEPDRSEWDRHELETSKLDGQDPGDREAQPEAEDPGEGSCQGKRLLIAGGGTGGHIYPGLAVAEEWRRRGGDVGFAGAPGNLEATLVPRAGYPFYPVEVKGLTRGRSLSARLQAAKAVALMITLSPMRNALRAVNDARPDVVLGVGGYVSGPTLLAARLRYVPSMILQLDAHPGIANRLASRFVDRIGVALPGMEEHFSRRDRVRLVGNPIRRQIVTARREEGIKAFGLDPDRQTLLIFGGSLGSRAINEATVGALQALAQVRSWAERRQVIHVTGRAHPISLPPATAERIGLKYLAIEYCDQLPLAMAAADLAVTRAGATTIAELTARGVASILIPWSGAADNHQEANARTLEQWGAARVILDSDLSPGTLAGALGDLCSDPACLASMAVASKQLGIPDAADRVVRELTALA